MKLTKQRKTNPAAERTGAARTPEKDRDASLFLKRAQTKERYM